MEETEIHFNVGKIMNIECQKFIIITIGDINMQLKGFHLPFLPK
jgi:hypothetical protein